MAASGRDELTQALRGAPVEGLETLSDEQLRQLAKLVVRARRRQAAALAAAADEAFDHIPRLLRGPVRKVLGA